MRWRDFDNLPPLSASFLDEVRHFHFVGIGGIGMSALAFYLLHNGHQVSGSDVKESDNVAKLRAAGAVIAIGHDAANLDLLEDQPDGLIYSSAVPLHNPERKAAAERDVTQWHRAQLLAAIANRARCSIAVSGTHGKSTTSAMIAHVLEQCGKNPTVLLGAIFPPFGSNERMGDPDLVVLEADESDGSFTLLQPAIAIVTNVEAEHLENYDESEERLWEAFGQFVASASDCALLNADQGAMFERLQSHATKVLSYSLQESDDAQPGVPGEHNRSNGAAALAVAEYLGVPRADAARALTTFHGISRRFEKVGEVNDIVIYDDYAHHPTEVRSTLQAAQSLERPVIAIFQPHRYSRTQHLGAQFGPCFEAADTVIITELYSAFEEPIAGVSGRIVFDAVRREFSRKKVLFAENLQIARDMATQLAQPGDAIFTIGAGDITKLSRELSESLRQPPAKVLSMASAFEPLSRNTTLKVGGAARWWIQPESEDELAAALQAVKRHGIPLRVLGAGSRLIISDETFDGAVLRLGGYFTGFCLTGDSLIAGGSAMLPVLTHFAQQQHLGGAEWMCGIPGTVGGALQCNADGLGFDGKEFVTYDSAHFLQRVTVFDRDGNRQELNADDIEFAYRRSSLSEFIVTGATFSLYPLDEGQAAEYRKAVAHLLKTRRRTQPLDKSCCGFIWKETNEGDIDRLMDELHCKRMRQGEAELSALHGNLVVNNGAARSEDVAKLIETIEVKVRSQHGITLDREAEWWGWG